MKFLQDTPTHICPSTDVNYVAYSDTDSIYIHAEPLLLHLYPNFEEFSEQVKDNILEKVALKYQSIITSQYDILTKECFNVSKHRLEMKTEAVIRAAYFRATRRYAQWITKQDGISKEILDVKGLEYKKSNFPKVFGNFFKKILEDVLKGAQPQEINTRILDFKKKVLTEMPINELGNPQGVKTLNKYIERKAVGTEMFTVLRKGAPAAVRATVKYNDLLKYWKLDKKYSQIVQGDKVKWIYLKKNPYNIEALAYLDEDCPPQIEDFLAKFADKEKVFDSILLNKLDGFYSDMEWKLTTNPYVNQFFI